MEKKINFLQELVKRWETNKHLKVYKKLKTWDKIDVFSYPKHDHSPNSVLIICFFEVFPCVCFSIPDLIRFCAKRKGVSYIYFIVFFYLENWRKKLMVVFYGILTTQICRF